MLFLDVGVYHDCSSPYFVSPELLLRCFEQLEKNKHVVRLNSENGGVFGSHAYAVTFDGAKKVLENSAVIQWPIGNHLMVIKGISRYAARRKMLYANEDENQDGDEQ
jgi:hypothetical protein